MTEGGPEGLLGHHDWVSYVPKEAKAGSKQSSFMTCNTDAVRLREIKISAPSTLRMLNTSSSLSAMTDTPTPHAMKIVGYLRYFLDRGRGRGRLEECSVCRGTYYVTTSDRYMCGAGVDPLPGLRLAE